MAGVKCTECGNPLDDSPDIPSDQRKPCPKCQSVDRAHSVNLAEDVGIQERMKLVGRDSEKGKPFMESVSGADFHRDSGKWVHLERSIDRKKDRYREIVKDPETGQVIHECEEPLSKHQGHGNARRKNKAEDGS